MATTDYLSVSQAAKKKGVSRSAIYQAVQSGKLPHTVIADKIAIKEKDIDAYTPIPLNQRKGIRMGGKVKKSAEHKTRKGTNPDGGDRAM